jgi:hypothetical protein
MFTNLTKKWQFSVLAALLLALARSWDTAYAQAEMQNVVTLAMAQSDACRQGYVWRDAFQGDHVCVTTKARTQARNDNSKATARREPGSDTCRSGYVWRLARPSDLVCVEPYIRALTASENRQAENHRDGGVYDYLRDEHAYKEPRWGENRYRLDWCFKWGSECGKAAADNFCKRQILTGAREFEIDPNIGASGPTVVSGTNPNQVCSQSYCAGFKYIICYGPIPNAMVFQNPSISATYNGSLQTFRLDECYTWDTGCGKKAADTYCYDETKYTKSSYYVLDAAPSNYDTLTIGTNEICDPADGWTCYGFQMIVCK